MFSMLQCFEKLFISFSLFLARESSINSISLVFPKATDFSWVSGNMFLLKVFVSVKNTRTCNWKMKEHDVERCKTFHPFLIPFHFFVFKMLSIEFTCVKLSHLSFCHLRNEMLFWFLNKIATFFNETLTWSLYSDQDNPSKCGLWWISVFILKDNLCILKILIKTKLSKSWIVLKRPHFNGNFCCPHFDKLS